ncbi:MAG TPA: polysaccharide deacetylase [Candidatus Faecimorpha stercoravium]|jgi:peptidoglycan/xylan/chitin deacetylase (PgdA/CDA1 family)|nr:polysaccharide deacetylase [Candidatus Faecimorpha stercoravium]
MRKTSKWLLGMWIAVTFLGGCAKEMSLDSSCIEPEPAYHVNAEATKKVYLTFDDGPCESTAQILDILQEYQVPAAFFVIVREEEELIPLYRRIVEEGHVLANHTATHVYEHVYASFENLREEIEELEDYVEYVSGYAPEKIFRFPGGSTRAEKYLGNTVRKTIEAWGYRVMDWNCSGDDAIRQGVTAEEIYDSTIQTAKGKNPVIILLHSASYAPQTVAALPSILSYFQENGYVFSSLLEEDAPENWWMGEH